MRMKGREKESNHSDRTVASVSTAKPTDADADSNFEGAWDVKSSGWGIELIAGKKKEKGYLGSPNQITHKMKADFTPLADSLGGKSPIELRSSRMRMKPVDTIFKMKKPSSQHCCCRSRSGFIELLQEESLKDLNIIPRAPQIGCRLQLFQAQLC